MSVQEQNRALAKRWFSEIWNKHRVATVDEIAAAGTTGHLEGHGTIDIEQFKGFHADMINSFPDLRVDVEETVAEGDHVVVRWRMHGTHTGNGFELIASGRRIDVPGITWFTFRDGKLVGGSDGWNQGALFQELKQGPE